MIQSKFTVRVELHSADWRDYEQLHLAMKKNGFVNTIQFSKGQLLRLPPAEYNIVGELRGEDVLARAKDSARVVGKRSAVLVTQSIQRWADGLEVVKDQR